MTARRYWDSDCFLGWFNQEPEKVAACTNVVDAAQAGEVQIVTSALTLTEVIKIKGKTPLTSDKEEMIRLLFENPFLIIRNVDRPTAEYARRLIWSHDFLKPKDSIHIATALLSGVQELDTFDGGMHALDGKLGDPPLRIGPPNLIRQQEMFSGKQPLEDSDEIDESEEEDLI